MRRRLFWLLFGWALGVLASNWIENRFRRSVNKYTRNTFSKFGIVPEEIINKRSELFEKVQKRFGNQESDFVTRSMRNSNSRFNGQESYLRRQHRPVRPQKYN